MGGATETIAYSYNAQGLVNSVNGFPVSDARSESRRITQSKIDYDEFGKRTANRAGERRHDHLCVRFADPPAVEPQHHHGSGAFIQKNTYGYDQVGHVIDHGEHGRGAALQHAVHTVAPGPTSYTFGYDNLYQLKTSTGAYTGVGAFGGRNYSVTMAYDEIGNITSKVQSDTLRATAVRHR